MRPIIAWALYALGHLISRWNDSDWRFSQTGFRLYQRLMLASCDVQGAGKGPWR